ncbi:alpha/beta hydrolase [Mycoplasmatota bacterium WC44]
MNYEVYGEGQDILILHGWGGDLTSLEEVGHLLKSKYKVWLLDLPGFGDSKIKYPYDLNDFVLELRKFVNDNGIEKPILIGHSFGGRIIIKYSVNYDVDRIVLIDSAGVVRQNIIYYYKVCSYKLVRTILRTFGHKNLIEKYRERKSSNDYNNSSLIMKEVLKKIYVDLRSSIKSISVDTLLIWGEKDTITPLKDGKLMNKLIEHSGLVIIPNAGHFPFLDNKNLFLKVLESYLL